jgi:hypothetical protein
MTTCTIPRPTPAAASSRQAISRSSNNFRVGYYSKLGIFPSQEASSCASQQVQPLIPVSSSHQSPSCLRHKRSVLHTTPAKRQGVTFHPEVRLYRIKHHQDYPDDEWNNMWVDADTRDYEKDRNVFEFQADGGAWRSAREEDEFQQAADGSLLHPATWTVLRQHGNSERAVNFKALLNQQGRRWSPRPKQRKTFWLFELAMESVEKGKNAALSRHPDHAAAAARHKQQQSRSELKPIRQADRGLP